MTSSSHLIIRVIVGGMGLLTSPMLWACPQGGFAGVVVEKTHETLSLRLTTDSSKVITCAVDSNVLRSAKWEGLRKGQLVTVVIEPQGNISLVLPHLAPPISKNVTPANEMTIPSKDVQ